MTQSHTPIDPLSRGRLRVWWGSTARRHARLEAVLDGRAFAAAARDYTHKAGRGRARALAKLKVLLAEAHFEEVAAGHALWSYLHPRDSVVCPNPGVGPAELQDCVCVNFIAIGQTWDHAREKVTRGRGTGLWSFEACAHALGRALQRDAAADLDAMLLAAHHAALAAAPRAAAFLLPAGSGAFVCSLRAGPDTSTGKDCFWVVGHTWLHSDQLTDDQTFAAAAPPRLALGAALLRPLALRHLATPESHP
jgi:hypothetical protein